MEQIRDAKDLELKELNQFIGTECYHQVYFDKSISGTDGIVYIMESGYSWLVTDMLAVVCTKPEIRKQEFLAIKLKVKDKAAIATIEDGNNHVLYQQDYKYTDAKKDLTLFLTNDVLMLSGEY
jgi:hypothetical protein